jgi:DNA-binding transcriptional LysR family regulator
VSLRDVAALPWVLPEAQGAFRRQVDALFIAAQTPVPANVVRCDSLLTTKAIVRLSDRITILPRQVAASELSIGVLRGIEIREAAFQRSIGVRLRAGRRRRWPPRPCSMCWRPAIVRSYSKIDR